jgi:uncharacterized protein YceH (UPF0502 family)
MDVFSSWPVKPHTFHGSGDGEKRMNEEISTNTESDRQWRPLSATLRRVVGVMIEKAKTTPDAYPLTLKALTTGCNQKSNRSPQMNLTEDDVEQALDQLREMSAVAEVQSSGRVPKYRHYMYEWLGVDKVELAVMAELMLRGEQTIGELRGRAARMEPIVDVNELRSILDTLIAKQLVIALTPPGRGQVVTHNLYSEEALQRVKQRVADHAEHAAPARSAPSTSRRPSVTEESFLALKSEVEALRRELQELTDRLDALER